MRTGEERRSRDPGFRAAPVSGRPHRRAGLGDRHDLPRHLRVQPLDHAAFDLDDPLAGIFRKVEGGDDLLRPGDLFRRRRERGVAGRDLLRVDQRLAVETEIARPAGTRQRNPSRSPSSL